MENVTGKDGKSYNVVADLANLIHPIKGLNFDPENANEHNEANITGIMQSLTRFGQDVPLVVAKDGMYVIKGNGRLESMRRLGWTHAAVVLVDDERKIAVARSLADNQTGRTSDWKPDVLRAQLLMLNDDADTPKPEQIGFGAKQLAKIFGTEPQPDEGDEVTLTFKVTKHQQEKIRSVISSHKKARGFKTNGETLFDILTSSSAVTQ